MFFRINKRKLVIIFFSLAILLGVFFRVYKFGDWMLFKGDSFRDAVLISHVYNEGLGNLPLLGPKAGGTMLHVGPIFYYFEYLSVLISRSTNAPAFAYPVLLFSLLSIPLAFIFFRKYFSQNWSFILTGLFSVSYVLIEYSRFAWNPNPAPFFNLLYFYSLLEILDAEKKEKKSKWFIAAAVSFSVSTQLHFVNFLALPVVSVILLAVNFKKLKSIFSWKKITAFFGIVALFYIPMILDDLISRGANLRQFFQSVKSKPASLSLKANMLMDIKRYSENFLRILTGYFGNSSLLIKISFCFFIAALAINIFFLIRENDKNKKIFLALSLILFGVFFVLYIPLAYNVDKPRFYLPIAMLPFVFLGYFFQFVLEKFKGLIGKFLVTVLIAVPFISNVYFVSSWFQELKLAGVRNMPSEDMLILKQKGAPVWWTWGHFQNAARYMENNCQGKSIYYMIQKEVREFNHSMEYAFRINGDKKPIHVLTNSVPYNSVACYYYVSITDSKISKNIDDFEIASVKILGNMSLTRFTFKPEQKKEDVAYKDMEIGVSADRSQSINRLSSKILSNKQRLFWKDVSYLFKP